MGETFMKTLLAQAIWTLAILMAGWPQTAATQTSAVASSPVIVLEKDYIAIAIQANKLSSQELAGLQTSALAGDAHAATLLGMAYRQRHDATEALRWYHLAADQGSSIAADQIGIPSTRTRSSAVLMDTILKRLSSGTARPRNAGTMPWPNTTSATFRPNWEETQTPFRGSDGPRTMVIRLLLQICCGSTITAALSPVKANTKTGMQGSISLNVSPPKATWPANLRWRRLFSTAISV
jgi:hypothetical protein